MTVMAELSIVFKIAGSILVIAAAALGGFYASGLDGFRIHDLREMKKALTILKSEIEFAATPLPEAMKLIAARTEKPVCLLFTLMGEKLDTRRRDTVAELWVEAVDSCKTSSYFHQEDLEPLYAFGKTLGYLDKNMQISAIELLIGSMDEKADMLVTSTDKNKRMYRSLGVLSGLLVVLIFL